MRRRLVHHDVEYGPIPRHGDAVHGPRPPSPGDRARARRARPRRARLHRRRLRASGRGIRSVLRAVAHRPGLRRERPVGDVPPARGQEGVPSADDQRPGRVHPHRPRTGRRSAGGVGSRAVGRDRGRRGVDRRRAVRREHRMPVGDRGGAAAQHRRNPGAAERTRPRARTHPAHQAEGCRAPRRRPAVLALARHADRGGARRDRPPAVEAHDGPVRVLATARRRERRPVARLRPHRPTVHAPLRRRAPQPRAACRRAARLVGGPRRAHRRARHAGDAEHRSRRPHPARARGAARTRRARRGRDGRAGAR